MPLNKETNQPCFADSNLMAYVRHFSQTENQIIDNFFSQAVLNGQQFLNG